MEREVVAKIRMVVPKALGKEEFHLAPVERLARIAEEALDLGVDEHDSPVRIDLQESDGR